MSYTTITVAHEEHVLIVTINSPDVINAVSPEANAELEQAFNEFENDDNLWVAIITGAGDFAFCAGGDISAMQDAKSEDDYKVPDTGYGGLTNRFSCDKPIIAAVNGLAFGGGFEIALACDLIIASDNASFALPEPLIGTAAVGSGMHRLIRNIGLKPAMHMLLTGHSINAEKALQLGLVNDVVTSDALMPAARKLAAQILKCAPLAIQTTKACAMQGLEKNGLEAAMQAQLNGEFTQLQTMYESQDIQQGISAFLQKRKPQWQGK